MDTLIQQAIAFLQVWVLPYMIILVIAFACIWFAFALSKRNQSWRARRALAVELRTNAKTTKRIVEYADSQLSGDTSVAPMPRYQTQAFFEYKKLALGRRIPPKILEELESLYLSKESVNEAGRRQEELAFGPAAAFPNAHTLRLENLTYLRDTAHNTIEPYLDRLKATRV
jgi:cbb3-type cytochrome oxidase subunit 3